MSKEAQRINSIEKIIYMHRQFQLPIVLSALLLVLKPVKTVQLGRKNNMDIGIDFTVNYVPAEITNDENADGTSSGGNTTTGTGTTTSGNTTTGDGTSNNSGNTTTGGGTSNNSGSTTTGGGTSNNSSEMTTTGGGTTNDSGSGSNTGGAVDGDNS